jgi:hypothetical protein
MLADKRLYPAVESCVLNTSIRGGWTGEGIEQFRAANIAIYRTDTGFHRKLPEDQLLKSPL